MMNDLFIKRLANEIKHEKQFFSRSMALNKAQRSRAAIIAKNQELNAKQKQQYDLEIIKAKGLEGIMLIAKDKVFA